jgi:hypothetical protein
MRYFGSSRSGDDIVDGPKLIESGGWWVLNIEGAVVS